MPHILKLGDGEVGEMFRVTSFLSVEDYCSYMNNGAIASETGSSFILLKPLYVTRNFQFLVTRS
ncbi:hypothetical protein [Nostoc foliaceum]|uniref:Uncharacterized protein n=1 Tax=Nostoc linckia FACHB-391 TaxID=2692906 RepID=A0ABR8ETD2_NOSLI|nr:hypothetical protein [Nostoc foliaceum]MBD2560347.1 hypothetical protein [Nostoc linckia FACHB-391]